MTEPTQPACATCRFWEQSSLPGESDTGRCRRNPPVIVNAVAQKRLNEGGLVLDATLDASTYPGTFAWEWCGEFMEETQ